MSQRIPVRLRQAYWSKAVYYAGYASVRGSGLVGVVRHWRVVAPHYVVPPSWVRADCQRRAAEVRNGKRRDLVLLGGDDISLEIYLWMVGSPSEDPLLRASSALKRKNGIGQKSIVTEWGVRWRRSVSSGREPIPYEGRPRRFVVVNVATVAFGAALRAVSTCEENTAYDQSDKVSKLSVCCQRDQICARRFFGPTWKCHTAYAIRS